MTSISTTKCFLSFLIKLWSKITQFQMLSESTIFTFNTLDFCEMIDLFLLISEIKFLCWWACQILGRDKSKNRDETEKCSISQGFEREFLPFVLE